MIKKIMFCMIEYFTKYHTVANYTLSTRVFIIGNGILDEGMDLFSHVLWVNSRADLFSSLGKVASLGERKL